MANGGHTHTVNLEWSSVMKRMNLRNALSVALVIGGPIAAANAFADTPQGGYGMGSRMMDGYGTGWMGGHGGMWMPILVVIVIVALVVWIIARKKK